MDIQTIRDLQKENGYLQYQEMIDDGSIWKFEGSMGRYAMELLRSGVCMLPSVPTFDYYGSKIPSRHMVKAGTTGSFELCSNYWENL